MGWLGAVDLIQRVARELVFGMAGLPRDSELLRSRGLPARDTTVVCMDGVDCIRRAVHGDPGAEAGTAHFLRFTALCQRLGLPLAAGKSLLRGSVGSLLGAELDGARGFLAQARAKTLAATIRGAVLLSLDQWTPVMAQHWAGIFGYAAGFRRPAFSVLESVFHFGAAPGDMARDVPLAARAEV